jgi:Family of unknown function (DUF6335)
MSSKSKNKKEFIDAGKSERKEFVPSADVQSEFDDASRLGKSGHDQLIKKLRSHHSKSPVLSGGDVDAAWDAADVGEESVGGENPTPDQDVVDELGKAVGIVYEDGEPLHTTEKVAARDKHRWELDPASSEGYKERIKHEGEYEEK